MIYWAICEKCRKYKMTDPHHIGGRGYDDREVRLCRKCHNWVHANKAEATKLGLWDTSQRWIIREKKPKKWAIKKKKIDPSKWVIVKRA